MSGLAGVAAPRGHPRFPLFDGLRAIAAISVLTSHVAGWSMFNTANGFGVFTVRMNIGVTIFFLISGFLLYRPFVAARVAGRPPLAVIPFLRRRALRILPAYWAALTLLTIWPGLDGVSDDPLRYYLLGQTYRVSTTLNGITPAWTLAVEVTYYLLLPLLAMLLARAVRGRRHWVRIELALLGLAAVACLGLRAVFHAHHELLAFQNSLLAYFDWFAYGMALAVLSVAWHGRESQSSILRAIVRRPWIPWALAALLFWVAATRVGLPRSVFLPTTAFQYQAEHLLFAASAALLLLPAVFGDAAGGWPRRLLALRPVAWLGLVSYGIYLYHLPLLTWLYTHHRPTFLFGMTFVSTWLLTMAISVACAALSYYLVERPALRFKDGWPRRAAATKAAPTAG